MKRLPALSQVDERCLPLRANDVGFAFDAAFGNDVVPSAQWANITSLATVGSNIIMSKASNITFAQAKTSLYLPPESKIQYNALYLVGKTMCKKDEKRLVLIRKFDF